MQRDGTIRFSVIVPVYNVQNYLCACVKSVVEQPGPADWECILVDDGSTDQSGAMCEALAAECPGVVALHQKNKGLAGARNTGIAAARGEWLLFLDSDDYWPAGMLQSLRAALEANPGYDWYAGRYLQYNEEEKELVEPQYAFQPGGFESGDFAARAARLYESCGWSVWKYCIRRQWLAGTGVRFCEAVRWAEDWPFDLELLHVCTRLCFVDVTMTVYRANRAGSLMDTGLPKHFAGILAALRHFDALFAAGGYAPAEQEEILNRAADVFWPQARAAAVPDKALRAACAPLIGRCRRLYDRGAQSRRGGAAQTAYRWMLKALGPRFALWAAGMGRGGKG